MMTLKRDVLSWLDGDMPFSESFGDHFYARNDGRAECGHVFLGGNGLPDRWSDGGDFTIGELGFGTGLNFLETWRHWLTCRKPGQTLHFVSFEAFPMESDVIRRAISQWSMLDDLCAALLARWPTLKIGGATWSMDAQTTLQVVVGDARETVPAWGGKADAWFLDGFAPARNEAMWETQLMAAVADHTVTGGTFATYTAAGWVRRNLQAAGFAVDKRPGYGGKREMMAGRLTAEG